MKTILTALMMTASLQAFAAPKDISEGSLPVETLRLRCDVGVNRALEYYAEGRNDDGAGIFELSREALETCRLFAKKAGGWEEVAGFVSAGKRLCHQSSDQRSELHEGVCLLKLADTVRKIVL